MSEPDYHAEMKLPEGKTCADCVNGSTCDALFGAVKRGFTSCDWYPRRFHQRITAPDGYLTRSYND